MSSDVVGACAQVPPLGQETVVGPGPSPPTLISTESGSRIVRAGHKRYFFDLGSNNKGHYLRITEVRSTISEPQKPSFPGDLFTDDVLQACCCTCLAVVSARAPASLAMPI